MDIFTEKLFVIGQKDAFPGAKSASLEYKGRDLSPIMPIKIDALQNIVFEDLYNEGIKFEQNDDTITVKLICKDVNGMKINIEKKFDFRNDVTILDSVPVIEIWPNFIAKGWKAYYTFIFSPDGSFQSQLDVKIITSETQIGDDKIKIIQTKSFPKIILCSFKKKEAGILLLSNPNIITILDKYGKIGIDLGAKEVNIYLCANSIKPFSISFKPNLAQITDSGTLRTQVYDWFLPSSDIGSPFQNVFHDFQKTKESLLRPLLDGHIYYLKDYLRFPNDKKLINVKWSEKSSDRYYFSAFFKQICLQCVAEAVTRGIGNIDWQFSYPDEFSLSDKLDLENILSSIIKFCSDLTGVKCSSPNLQPKSFGLARFFAEHSKMSAPVATGAICLNIDDESTDIHVWQNNELIYGMTIPFSNGNLFFIPLMKNLELISVLTGDSIKKFEKIKDDSCSFFSLIDELVKDQEKRWLNNMSNYIKNPYVNGFIQLIFIGLSGLYYYIGLLIKYLIKSSIYNGQNLPSIYVGGKGTHLFDWIAGGDYNKNKEISNYLKKVFMRSSELSGDLNMFDIKISPLSKAEIAFGLACSEVRLDYSKRDNLFQTSDPLDWYDKLLGQTSNSIAQDELKHFKDFLQFLKESESLPIYLSLNQINFSKDLLNRVYNRLSSQANDAESISLIEPYFIKELKILLKEKTNDWLSEKI